nr:hypothetical protein Iba_chr01cCG5310 [Ipomoea batatas]
MVEIFSGDGNSGGGSRGSDFDWRLLAMVELWRWLLRVMGSSSSSGRSLAIAISPLFPILSRMFSSGGDSSGGRWIGNDEILGAGGDDSLMSAAMSEEINCCHRRGSAVAEARGTATMVRPKTPCFAGVADASTVPIYTRAESLLPPLQSSTMLPHRHHRTQLQAVLEPPQPPLVVANTADVTAADHRRPDPAISPRH